MVCFRALRLGVCAFSGARRLVGRPLRVREKCSPVSWPIDGDRCVTTTSHGFLLVRGVRFLRALERRVAISPATGHAQIGFPAGERFCTGRQQLQAGLARPRSGTPLAVAIMSPLRWRVRILVPLFHIVGVVRHVRADVICNTRRSTTGKPR